MTIYLDAVWALNFLLDMMLLMLTQVLAKEKTAKLRIVCGAFIASLLVPITFYFPNTFITTIYGKLMYSILIIIISFPYQTIYRLIKVLGIFYFITFSIGGGLIATHFLLNNPVSLSEQALLNFDSGYGDPISWMFIVIGFPITYIFTKRQMDKHAIEKIRYDQLCPVTVQIKKTRYSTSGFIDSGNQLVDPITKRPVIICDEVFLKQWFSNEDWNMMKEAHVDLDLAKIPHSWTKLVHIIPYHGVEGKSRFLLGIRPEKVVISYHGDKIIAKNVLIGIQFASLTKDELYHCLLQPQIIKLMTTKSA